MKKIQSKMDKVTKLENENTKSEHPPEQLAKLVALTANQMVP